MGTDVTYEFTFVIIDKADPLFCYRIPIELPYFSLDNWIVLLENELSVKS